jgi:hypothetical protein
MLGSRETSNFKALRKWLLLLRLQRPARSSIVTDKHLMKLKRLCDKACQVKMQWGLPSSSSAGISRLVTEGKGVQF